MKFSVSLIALLTAVPAFAENTRQMDAHEHGVGTLNIAIEGAAVAMEFEAPGADIVGFEYGAKTDADLAAIEVALATLSAPLELFVMPVAAACTATNAKAELASDDAHGEHDQDHHDEHHQDGDHKDGDHQDGDHKDEEHDDHDDHDDHAEETGHTEFHAQYTLACENPEALSQITFDYFAAFPNAQEVEVQIIDASGARAFEVARDTPVLELDR